MNNKSLKIGILINFVATLAIGIMTFLVNKYFAEFMGVNELGLMRLFTQLLSYLSLAELGLGTASAYSLYKPLIEKNYEKINIIVSTIDSIYKKISMCILLIGLLMNFLLSFIIKDFILDKYIYLCWSLYVLNTSLSYIYAKFVVLFTANEEYGYVRIIQGITKVITQVVQVFILVYYKSFVIFIIVFILENLLQYLIYKKYYIKKYSFIKKVKKRDYTIKKNMLKLFWHKIGALIIFNTDYILIAKFISLEVVGKYSSYIIIVNMAITLVSIVSNVLSPKIGIFINKNDDINNFLLWKKLNVVFLYVGIVITYVTYNLINSFVYLWLGNEYILPDSTKLLLMVNLFLQLTTIVNQIFKNGYGYFEDTYLPFIEALINLFVSVLLINLIGLNGVIIGTITSNIIIIYIFKPILIFKNCFKISWKKYLKELGSYLTITIVIVISLKVLKEKIILETNIETWSKFIMQGFKLTIIFGLYFFVIFLTKKDFRSILLDVINYEKLKCFKNKKRS